MTERDTYIQRKEAWDAFNQWESEHRLKAYADMPYEKKVAEFEELYRVAQQRNPEIFEANHQIETPINSSEYRHRLEMVELRKKMRHYVT